MQILFVAVLCQLAFSLLCLCFGCIGEDIQLNVFGNLHMWTDGRENSGVEDDTVD